MGCITADFWFRRLSGLFEPNRCNATRLQADDRDDHEWQQVV